MKQVTRILRPLVILLLVSVKPVLHALPDETEYQGTFIVSGQADDKKWGAFPIGFDFVFYGNTYNEFYVSSNGLVMFGAGSNQFNNLSIPDDTRPDNFIALFWDDLIVHSTGDIMYRTIGVAPNRKLVIQFSNMSFWTSTVLLGTMQVILYEGSNEIQLQYRSIIDVSSDRASGSEATIGLENSDGTAGVLCSYYTAGYIYSGKAIHFTPDGDNYTFDDRALYEGILLVDVIPKAGIPELISPVHNSVVGETVTFNWEAASNATSYFVIISQNSDLSSPLHTSADLTDLSYSYALAPDQTYYWSANAKNSEGTISWSEIWMFRTSSSPPLLAVPKTINLEQGDIQELTLSYTGGDEGSKTATISSLPGEGILYQSSDGTPGDPISAVPTDVKDAAFRLFYSASEAAGTGAGNFRFHFTDGTGSSPDTIYTIHVSPPGIPVFQTASKEVDRVEITFDRNMADPTGKHLEFAVRDDGVDVTPTSCVLKAGDPATIVVYVTPNLDTGHTITVAYTRGTVTSASGGFLETFDFQVAGKVAQHVTFDPLPDRTYGDAGFELSATASSGLPVSFSSSNTAVVSISGNTATINNAGEAFIYATQDGDNTFSAATTEQIQVVNKAPAAVTLSDLTHDYTGAGMPATVTTDPADLNIHVTYNGSTSPPVDPGTYTVIAEIVETNYMGSATGLLSIADVSPPVPDLATLPILIDECSVTPVPPTATDNYAGTITGTTGTPFPITDQGTTVITWTYDDGNGNTSTQTQNVAINDVTEPVDPALSDQFIGCAEAVSVPTTTDACAGTITGTTADPLTYAIEGTYVINWTFNDGNGNSIAVVQNVTVADLLPPEVPVLPDLTGDCSVTAVAPTTVDACAGTITGTTTDPLTYDAQGTYVINWTFDDGNGNSITVGQNVTVADLLPPEVPVLPDLTGDCSVTAVAPATVDACAGSVTGTTTDPLTYDAQGTYVIHWTFDDGNGNSVSADQNVVVSDVTPPSATAPSDVSTCDGTVSSIGLSDVTDNCSTPVGTYTMTGATTGSGSGTDVSSTLFNPGVTTVTYTLDDGNGNSTQYTVTVTYQEVEDIVVTLSGGTLTCENSGSYQWINCADNSIIEGETGNTFSPVANGSYAVILTQGDCSATSDCYSLDYTGIGDGRAQDYRIYPNPAHAYVTLEMDGEQTHSTIRIVDMTGQVIRVEELDRFSTADLDLSDLKNGLYMIHIHSDQMDSVARIIKK